MEGGKTRAEGEELRRCDPVLCGHPLLNAPRCLRLVPFPGKRTPRDAPSLCKWGSSSASLHGPGCFSGWDRSTSASSCAAPLPPACWTAVELLLLTLRMCSVLGCTQPCNYINTTITQSRPRLVTQRKHTKRVTEKVTMLSVDIYTLTLHLFQTVPRVGKEPS